MSQVTSLSVENSNGLAVRTGFNGLIAAVNSQHSGGTAPTETVPYMMWADTSSTPATLKMRNAANNGWLLIGTIDEAAGQFLPNGQISGRNLIINGSGRTNQRGYTTGAATIGANQFTLDRWFVQVSGQSLTFTGDSSRRIMTAPAGGVAQAVEGRNIIGGTYVLNWDGTATATVNGTSRVKGEAFTLTGGANAIVRFSSGTFTDVQLERGQIATPFEWISTSDELQRCQRYYCRVNAEFRNDANLGSTLVSVGEMWFYPVAMRDGASVSVVAETGSNAGAIATLTDKGPSGAFLVWEWQNGNTVATRNKAAIIAADAELVS